MKHAPAKSSLRSSKHAVKQSLLFATFLNYDACKGYRYLATSEEINIVTLDAGYSVDPQECVDFPRVDLLSPPAPPPSPSAMGRAGSGQGASVAGVAGAFLFFDL